MERLYQLSNLCCAACAAKMEHKISKIKGVDEAILNFFTMKLLVESSAENYDEIEAEILKVIKKSEPDCKVEII